MKKLFIFLLAFSMATVFSACAATQEPSSAPADTTVDVTVDTTVESPADTTVDATVDTTVEAPVDAIIEAKDCYANAGYIEFVAGADRSAEYTFTAENSETAKWRVYVFDQEFEDGFRYITQAAEPVLEGDGTISVAEGQFIYVYCSVNEFTADAADEHAKLNVIVE